MASTRIVPEARLTEASAEYSQLFSPSNANTPAFFDEGPQVVVRPTKKTNLSGSLNNLSGSYAYVQGVEITQQEQYVAGLVKVWSGDAGHVLRASTFGQDGNLFRPAGFADAEKFSALQFVKAQANGSPLWSKTLAYPLIVGDIDQVETVDLTGVIEPLTIRAAAGMFSTFVPAEAHSIQGSVGEGNRDPRGGGEAVLTVDFFAPKRSIVPFLDQVNATNTLPTPGFFQNNFAVLDPFLDARYSRNTTSTNGDVEDAILIDSMDHMTGSTDNYIRFNQRSATCGWSYDANVAIGTDSLVFGGLTH